MLQWSVFSENGPAGPRRTGRQALENREQEWRLPRPKAFPGDFAKSLICQNQFRRRRNRKSRRISAFWGRWISRRLRRMRSLSPGQRLFVQRREAQRKGTSSDPLRGPPSPEGKATGTSSAPFGGTFPRKAEILRDFRFRLRRN